MATIGVSKPYYAIYAADAGKVTYTKGALLGRAAEFSLELEGGDSNILYLDNAAAESANEFAGGTMTITTGELLPETAAGMLGIKLETLTVEGVTDPAGLKEEVYSADDNIPYVGFGVIIKGKVKGKTQYRGVVLPKIQFTTPNTSAVTQGESIEWQTQELTATIMRDDSTAAVWQRAATFNTEVDAEKYIKSKLSISLPA